MTNACCCMKYQGHFYKLSHHSCTFHNSNECLSRNQAKLRGQCYHLWPPSALSVHLRLALLSDPAETCFNLYLQSRRQAIIILITRCGSSSRDLFTTGWTSPPWKLCAGFAWEMVEVMLQTREDDAPTNGSWGHFRGAFLRKRFSASWLESLSPSRLFGSRCVLHFWGASKCPRKGWFPSAYSGR